MAKERLSQTNATPEKHEKQGRQQKKNKLRLHHLRTVGSTLFERAKKMVGGGGEQGQARHTQHTTSVMDTRYMTDKLHTQYAQKRQTEQLLKTDFFSSRQRQKRWVPVVVVTRQN